MALRKLTSDELEQALDLAQAMREKDKDKYNLGHALLYLQQRNKLLEDLRVKADYYIRFGMGTRELTDLRKALEHLHELDTQDEDDSSLFSG